MKRWVRLLPAAATLLAPSSLFAPHFEPPDGINLLLSLQGPQPGPQQVLLEWTGGQPLFQIYRSTSPQNVLDPANLLGESPSPFWVDPAVGDIFYYKITTPCAYNPPERCDGLDNDCDGATDDAATAGCFCQPGSVQACGPARGTCSEGIQQCQPDGTWGACTGAVGPDPERCDGLDNDCDGDTDESFGVGAACLGRGECGQGVRECAGTLMSRCSADPGGTQDGSVPEVCDGLDNDCDASTDEVDAGCACAPGSTQPCGRDEGECVSGTQTCDASGAWGACTGGTARVLEACDGLDNDCDAQTDEGIVTRCGAGECATTGTCMAGADTCEPLPSGPEVCDGLDNDCDAQTDEDYATLAQPCDGEGECGSGVRECQGPSATGCSSDPAGSHSQALPEACDGKDNDCDASTDEDFVTRGQPCDGADSDSCANGTFTCRADGTGVECVNESPVNIPEICDGLDNDCDASTDEGAGCFGLGTPCTVGPDCGSGFCFDGVCCDSDCTGDCRSCGQAGMEGTCAPLPPGTQDSPCDPYTCAGGGVCGTTCASDLDCAATHVCETDMTCRARCFSDADCAGGYACRPDQHCQPSCASDLDCAAGYFCDVPNGLCVNANLFGARLSSGGVLLATDIPIQVAPYDQREPAIAFDGTNYLVAWVDTRSNPAGDIFYDRYSVDAVAIGPGPIQVQPGPVQSPAVAFGGGNYVVVWAEGSGGSRDIRGTRVSPSGTVLDDPSIPIATAMEDDLEPAVASDGASFLVVWTRSGGATPGIYATRVSDSGTVLDAGGIWVGTNPGPVQSPAVAWNGTNYLVVWADGSAGSLDIRGARVSAAGVVLDDPSIPISTGSADESEPTVAADGTDFLAAWTDFRSGNGDVYGARVSAAGAVLDPMGVGFYLDPGLDAQPVLVHADFSTTGWVGVAFGNDDPSGGLSGDFRIRALPIDTTPPDPPTTFTPIPVSEGFQLRWNPAAESDLAGYELVWEDYRPVSSGPFSGQTDGETCALNADCASGFCTGGICCDSACSLANANSSCSTGTCTIASCAPGFGNCDGNARDGCETPLDSNPDACGACGAICSSSNMETRTCGGGVCDGICVTGFSDCDGNKLTNGCEVDITTTTAHCGACNAGCSSNNMATLACASGMCLGTCSSGFDDCNLDLRADGCETDLLTSTSDCGGCGLSCSNTHGTTTCLSGACVPTCASGFADCDGNPGNGCETNTKYSCGACTSSGASCREILARDATAASGVYLIDVAGAGPGEARPTYCDMTTDGGGWTAMFVGKNGRVNAFDHFDTTSHNGQYRDAERQLLRRKPAWTGLAGSELLVSCGAAQVKLPLTDAVENYFSAGTQVGWTPIVSTAIGGTVPNLPNWLYTGGGGTLGFIFAKDQNSSFGFASIHNDSAWDRCNSVADASSPVRVFYREPAPAACAPGTSDCDADPTNGCETNTVFWGGVCAPAGASCKDILSQQPGAPSGNYFIDVDGPGQRPPVAVYCDMATDGGGWTAMFVGKNGSPNVFDHFDAGPHQGTFAVPTAKYLRRKPAWSTTSGGDLAVQCGSAMVKFPMTAQADALFAGGVQSSWVDLDPTVIAGTVPDPPNWLWTGSGSNFGFIFAKDQSATLTFGSSYAPDATWDSCNGTPDTTSTLRVFYREPATPSCAPGTSDCDADPTNGCETNTVFSGGVCVPAGANCKDILSLNPGAPSGNYFIDVDGPGQRPPVAVYCDMATDGGGWTAMFVGKNGSANVFDRFDHPGYVGLQTNPSGRYLQRKASWLSTAGVEAAVSCGAAMVKFPMTGAVENYFSAGIQAGWTPIDSTAIGGTVPNPPNWLWTGSGSNFGFIFAKDQSATLTFGSSYAADAAWDSCNGTPDTTSTLRVFYREPATPSCAAGASDCDGDPTNGCETDDAYTLGPCQGDRSCREILRKHPGAPSGEYLIDTDGAGPKAAVVARCDMTTDGGGYTMVRIDDLSLGGDQRAYAARCAALGMEVIVPQTKAHAQSIYTWNGLQPANLVNVFPKFNGAVSLRNWQALCGGSACPFWISDQASGFTCGGAEPSGDNSVPYRLFRTGTGCGIEGTWNDANNIVAIPGRVLCSPNDKLATAAPPPSGFSDCDGNAANGCETDIRSSTAHCGACNVACSSNNMASLSCTSGVCNGTCAAGFEDCNGNKQTDGCEADLLSSTAHCGACNVACSSNNMASLSCTSGVCNGTCAAGFADCNGNRQSDGCETNLNTLTDCGACGITCARANATATCATGSCAIGSCNLGFDSCDGLDANGCEADLSMEGNCGGCGVTCSQLFCAAGATCQAGTCAGGTPTDCEDGIACTVDSCNEALDACEWHCSQDPCFVTPVGPGPATAPVSDPFDPTSPTTYIGKGTTLYAIRNVAEGVDPPGSIRWQTGFSATVQNFPSPVPLSNGSGTFLFVATEDGVLSKINAVNGVVAGAVDTRRPTCSADSLAPSPAVQLSAFSNQLFRDALSASGHPNDDLVFVITRYACGTQTENRVLALHSSDLTTKWVFNATGTYMVDRGSEGCSVDYASNTLFCGTDLQSAGASQNTLWAIDTATATGALLWSHNAGAILNRPTLGMGPSGLRLYVVNFQGSIMAYGPGGNGAGGASPLWSAPAQVGATVTRNPWVEFRPGFAPRILVVDDGGNARVYIDQGATGTRVWTGVPGTGMYVSMPVVQPGTEKVYLGRSDGQVEQLNLADGSVENAVVAGTGFPWQPGLQALRGDPDRALVLAADDAGGTGQVGSYCVPWCGAATPGGCGGPATNCADWTTPCTQGQFDFTTWVCVSTPLVDGSACDDGKACTQTNDVCVGGACVSNDYSACPCTAPGDPACASGETCCGSGACVILQADPDHCGACGASCSSNNMATRTCTGGVCSGTCAARWADCDGNKQSNGCETNLNSPTDCGSCGFSCDDFSDCTNDVCNPSGTCANVDGSGCFQPACAGGACGFTDTDGDGLNDTWETNGYIDNNCNGMNDPATDTPLPGADVNRPNIYVKYDYMVKAGSGAPCVTPAECPGPGEQCVGGLCTGHSHAPSPLALDLVRQAFLAQNVVLTFDPVSQEIPESTVVTFDSLDPACAGPDAVSFYQLKSSNFAPPLRTAYHYVIFAHFNTCDSPTTCAACPASPDTGAQPVFGATGIAELMGNDAIVSLGALPSSAPDVTIRREAGTAMHELGHNLSLRHGGGDDLDQKPNYFSVMNRSYQFGIGQSASPGPYPTTEVDPSTSHRIDYSGQILNALDEGTLAGSMCVGDGLTGGMDEPIGVSGDPASPDVVKFFRNPGPNQLYAPSNMTPVDWNFNGFSGEMHVYSDINADGQCTVLQGFNDWAWLANFLAFQCSPNFAD